MIDSKLVGFNNDTRRVWMFPRNIRNIDPWKLNQILTVLMEYTPTSDVHAQDVQDLLYNVLSKIGVKANATLHDPKAGGMRTYFSQLECLGLIYKRQDKSYEFTIAGENMWKGIDPQKVLQFALLRHQYPSSYSISQNVKIDRRVKVKPFIFILKLLTDPRISGYITSSELQVPIVYGHNFDCFEYCIEKILEMRNGKKFVDVLDNPIEDLYTPRGSRILKKATDNVSHIANTAKNYLQAAGLIICDIRKIGGQETYVFNNSHDALYQKEYTNKDDFISYPENKESFQRSYGRYDMQKDTRPEGQYKKKKNPGAETLIKLKCIEYMKDNPFSENFVADYCDSMKAYGFEKDRVMSIIDPLLTRKTLLEESVYLEYANSGGVKAIEFGKATKALLENLGFDKSLWIGSRKKKLYSEDKFSAVYIAFGDSLNCGLADTKTSITYTLNQKRMLALADNYLDYNKEIVHASSLKYFVYIAGGFKGDVNKSLRELSDKIHIPVSAITAQALLNLKHSSKFYKNPELIEKELFMSNQLTFTVSEAYLHEIEE